MTQGLAVGIAIGLSAPAWAETMGEARLGRTGFGEWLRRSKASA